MNTNKSRKNISLLFTLVIVLLLAFPAGVLADSEEIGEPAEEESSDIHGMTLMAAPAAAGGQAGTTLSSEVTAVPTWEIVYAWEIDKSVNPEYIELYVGDQGPADYTIALIKDNGTESAFVEGYIYVANGGERATENLYIKAILEAKKNITSGGYQDYVPETSNEPDLSFNPVLDPGETGSYYYYIAIPAALYPYFPGGLDLRIRSIVTITNHSGHLGEPFGPETKASFSMPTAPTKINDTVHVSDTNGMSWNFSTSASVSYTKMFLCREAGTFEYVNTATIDETGQWDDAKVTVNCLQVSGKRFTIGFWKNHAGLGNGNQADVLSQYLPIWLGGLEVSTAAQAVAILSNMGSNGISKLYAQLLAAKLNIANGAPAASISPHIAQAEAFLTGKTEASWTTLSKTDQKKVLGWMDKFDLYNNGF